MDYKRSMILSAVVLFVCIPLGVSSEECVECHLRVTPNIVSDWNLSKHREAQVGCPTCHDDKHKTAQDVVNAVVPTPEICAGCHEERVRQFKDGKHALAWSAMTAMPTFHWQPMALTEGMKGCGGCHKIGLKTYSDLKGLRAQGSSFGMVSCDACHTRHVFSLQEARQPQACQTCHMGFDHPQWEMFSSSKHGVRYLLKQSKVLPETVAAPTCQTCHMDGGSHAVRTSWGFLGVRLPMPNDKQWEADRRTILQGLGVLDSQGNPTERLDLVKAADLARLSDNEWQANRDKMVGTCNRCHSGTFARGELNKGDQMIREADSLMAEAVRMVVSLYQDGFLKKPQGYARALPDLLTLYDAPTVIEQKLFVMFLEHRMRTFQGVFHANPDYALWYGWSEMKRDLVEIKALAAELREKPQPRSK
jgi:hydroxylamine dehydrogenase